MQPSGRLVISNHGSSENAKTPPVLKTSESLGIQKTTLPRFDYALDASKTHSKVHDAEEDEDEFFVINEKNKAKKR